MKQKVLKFISLLFLVFSFFLCGFLAGDYFDLSQNPFISPLVENNIRLRPLQQYSISNLSQRKYETSDIVIEDLIEENDKFNSYLFSYTSMGKRITGQVNIPKTNTSTSLSASNTKPITIVMIRGYIPVETYKTGDGTKSAAAVLAEHGYITLAPDFLGFGGSDAEPENVWEARFIKPMNVIELIESIKANRWIINDKFDNWNLDIGNSQFAGKQIGLWSHSNGGQIAASVLEITGNNYPTTMWTPMLAPFPYSILYFGWDEEDEGKEQRKWISLFEKDYDVFDFSVTQHTDRIKAPIQIQAGGKDDQVLPIWLESFLDKLDPETYTYHYYPSADHNLKPNWNEAIQNDLDFFAKQFQ